MPVIGTEELQRAFALAGSTFQKEKRSRLRFLAEPVRRDAEQLALMRIRKIGPEWYRMRTGATPTMGYVASANRGTRDVRKKRRELADLLMARAMKPALERNAAGVEKQFDDMVRRMDYRFRSGR